MRMCVLVCVRVRAGMDGGLRRSLLRLLRGMCTCMHKCVLRYQSSRHYVLEALRPQLPGLQHSMAVCALEAQVHGTQACNMPQVRGTQACNMPQVHDTQACYVPS